MIYQALYRKYRPKTFDQVSGQNIVITTLKNAILNNKLSHAYLFIGPRGTGKTSIAKIFAKTINCEHIDNGNSCEKCDICNLSNNNENVDIIEMDAASNNGVDEIREIKNHVTLMPTFSKYKVYIIDEVHMLSSGAFNALLKTLEEPPKHVIFILATTEPQKVPLTILSRCQCFEFKPISTNNMKNRLVEICNLEKIKYSDDALKEICYASNGGMRDAISLLDQVNSYCNGNIVAESVSLLNGRVNKDSIKNFFEYIYTNNLEELFSFSDKINDEGKDYIYLCEDLIKFLKDNLIDYQINKNNMIVDKLSKEKVISIIYEINDCMTYIKNIKDKKIFFDLLIIKLTDMYKTNVRSKLVNVVEHVEKDNNISIDINKVIEKENFNNEKKNNKNKDDNISLYQNLMDIRLNNILASADKESFNEYIQFYSNLENDLNNLDERKIFNLLMDCTIKAGSKDGIIFTTSNSNILIELYNEYKEIEKLLSEKMQKQLKICIYDENNWNNQRKIYVNKIKNKEKIEIQDEEDVLLLLNQNIKNEKNDFDDLLEIGE